MQKPNVVITRPVSNKPRRPVDKEVTIQADLYGTTQINSEIHTSTTAETFTGGHITGFTTGNTGATYPCTFVMALVYVRAGQNVPTLAVTDGFNIEPAQSVLWCGIFRLQSATDVRPINNSGGNGDIVIRTMRKMNKGDTIFLTGISSQMNSANVVATMSFFYKQ